LGFVEVAFDELTQKFLLLEHGVLLVPKCALYLVVATGSGLSPETAVSSRRSLIFDIAEHISLYHVGSSDQRFPLRLQARLNLLPI
jgi:hypothetical protein